MRTVCIRSTKVRTMKGMVLRSPLAEVRDSPRGADYGLDHDEAGDGVVNHGSLRACDAFSDEVVELERVGHRAILSDERVAEAVAGLAAPAGESG